MSISICAHMCSCAFIYIYIYIYMYTCIYIYTSIISQYHLICNICMQYIIQYHTISRIYAWVGCEMYNVLWRLTQHPFCKVSTGAKVVRSGSGVVAKCARTPAIVNIMRPTFATRMNDDVRNITPKRKTWVWNSLW